MFFHWKLQDLPSLWLRLQPFKFCLGSGSTALALTGLWERFDSFQTQHKTQECSRSPTNINNYDNSDRNCAQHSTYCRDDYYRHTGIAYHVAYNAQGRAVHHGFSLLISVECACVKHNDYP